MKPDTVDQYLRELKQARIRRKTIAKKKLGAIIGVSNR